MVNAKSISPSCPMAGNFKEFRKGVLDTEATPFPWVFSGPSSCWSSSLCYFLSQKQQWWPLHMWACHETWILRSVSLRGYPCCFGSKDLPPPPLMMQLGILTCAAKTKIIYAWEHTILPLLHFFEAGKDCFLLSELPESFVENLVSKIKEGVN